ncbi:glycerate kinase family protein [Mycolicibacterium thermoresistibile]
MAGRQPDSAARRVLIAPDSFGGTLTAVQAAEAIAAGWRRARSGDSVIVAPQSDGGPGFVDVLATRLGERRSIRVSGPLSDQVEADWLFDAADPATAYVECAQACGLTLLGQPPGPQTAVAAHSRGVGELIGAALAAGARRIVVGLGGSSCTDGGRGMIEAFGTAVDVRTALADARAALAGVELIAATDVEHPLLGPMGAAAVFGPQKGADPATVARLEDRLAGWAVELARVAGRDVSAEPGAGAAGGLGAALLALGGQRKSGASVIAEHTGLTAEVAVADVVITGEGRLDDQSVHGKVVSALAEAARDHGATVLVLAGQVQLDAAAIRAAGIDAAYALADHAGSVRRASEDAENQLTTLAERIAGRLG